MTVGMLGLTLHMASAGTVFTAMNVANQRARLRRPALLACIVLLSGWQWANCQCQATVGTVETTARCVMRSSAPTQKADIDPNRPYTLPELIDIAESNNPQTRMAWESAKQAADLLGLTRSEYYPQLAALALADSARSIVPWPKPLNAPKGYLVTDTALVQSGVGLEYNVYDFGRREGKVDAAKALRLASAAAFQRTNQEVAFRVVTSYFTLITAQERLEASRQIVKTAETTKDAAEAQLANGRATLPDVLNARAAAAQARYDLEASIGGVDTARVVLRETIGVEPSDQIRVEEPAGVPLPAAVSQSTTDLVEQAMQQRPDLRAIAEKLKASNAAVRSAKAEYLPSIRFIGAAGEESLSSSVNTPGPNPLGHGSEGVWNVAVSARWDLFDGGRRRNEVRLMDSQRREEEDEKREKEDAIGREVWIAYVQFRTAVRQHEAAETLLTSASTSYDASLDAYRYGVKNLVDLVTAENQLAQARLAVVQSRSAVRIDAANLDYATGNLLRRQPPVAQPAADTSPR